MLNKDVFDSIIANSNVDQLTKALEAAGLGNRIAVVPTTFVMKDMEQYQAQRYELRGTFMTTSYEDLTKYVTTNGTKFRPYIFVDESTMTAEAIIDFGTEENAGHQRHRATHYATSTAAFNSLQSHANERTNQRDLAEWIEDLSANIIVENAQGDAISNTDVANAIRDLNFEVTRGVDSTVGDFSSKQSTYEAVAAKTRAEISMPSSFKFKCVPYQNLPEREFLCRISILDGKVLKFRIANIETHIEEMAVEYKKEIMKHFNESGHEEVNVVIGKFK